MTTLDLDKLSPEENQLLNSIAVDVRAKFHSLIDTLARGKENNIHWVVSNIASRNKYYSPLFIRCCQLSLVKKLVEENNVTQVSLSDNALAEVLKKYYSNRRIHVSIICAEGLRKKVKKHIAILVQYFKVCYLYALRFFGCFRSDRIKFKDYPPLTLLDTFVINSKIGEEGSIYNGKYKDRYYPGLLDALTENEQKTLFYLPSPVGFKNQLKAFKIIRSSKSRFLIRDDFLRISDYLFSLQHPLQVLKLRFPKTLFSDFDITPLLKQENYYNCCNPNCLEGLLNYRFAYRLAKENIKVKLVVEWYENQPLDKGAIVGFHHFHPETQIVGYQGYIISRILHHYVYPTNSEFRSQAVPDKVAVIGKGLVDDVKEFCDKVNVITAPAFRNQNVWQKRKYYPEAGKFTILVALPIDLNESGSILKLLSQLPANVNKTEIRFLIKPHPSYGPEQIEGFMPNGWLNIDIKTGYFNDYVEKADLLISNASITSVEALAKGVPVIIIGDKNGIIQNPIPNDVPEDMWELCFTPEEIQKAINNFIDKSVESKNLYKEIGDTIKEKYFEPVTTEKVRMFLSLDEHL